MIKGLGSDIISVARIQKAIDRNAERFLETVFTDSEITYCQKHQESARHFAGRFAAKEALVKAIGTGFRQGITWKDIEVYNDELGKPHYRFSEKVLEIVGEGHFMLTISHCHEFATATALWLA